MQSAVPDWTLTDADFAAVRLEGQLPDFEGQLPDFEGQLPDASSVTGQPNTPCTRGVIRRSRDAVASPTNPDTRGIVRNSLLIDIGISRPYGFESSQSSVTGSFILSALRAGVPEVGAYLDTPHHEQCQQDE